MDYKYIIYLNGSGDNFKNPVPYLKWLLKLDSKIRTDTTYPICHYWLVNCNFNIKAILGEPKKNRS